MAVHPIKRVMGISVLFLLFGCGYKYTQHADVSMKGKLIQQESIAVFPLENVIVIPTESCFSASTPYRTKTTTHLWDEGIKNKLAKKFPNQKWYFIEPNDIFFRKESRKIDYIRALAKEKTTARLISGIESSPLKYEHLPKDTRIGAIFKEMHDSLQVSYAILFLKPVLKNEFRYTPSLTLSIPSGGLFPGLSQRKVCKGDVQIQVWDCRNGQMIYNSGSYQVRGASCLKTPEETTMVNATKDLVNKLLDVIEVIIKYRLHDEYVIH
jgi:hypothetical protein